MIDIRAAFQKGLGGFDLTLPRGKQQSAAAREVNRALRTLKGQKLELMRLSAGPSSHTLVLETDRCKLTLELDSAGARVASLETG